MPQIAWPSHRATDRFRVRPRGVESAPHGRARVPGPLPPVPAPALRRAAGAGARHPGPHQCRPREQGGPRLPVQWPAGHRQDVHGPHPGQGAELHRPARTASRAATCDSCVQVQQGTSLDVHELDAASNNGVDAMRDLVSRAALGTPGRWKVYIVDEVHMLSTPASNALLKTLEEPPGARGVRAGHDRPAEGAAHHPQPHPALRVPAAAARRPRRTCCTTSTRRRASACRTEAIDLAVRRGRGSARDALSVLDQVAAAGEADDEVPVSGRDGRGPRRPRRRPGAGGGGRRVAPRAATRAGWPKTSSAHLRNAFLALMARSLVDLPDDAAVQVEEQARRLGPAGLTRAMEALGDALTDMREALDPRVSLEVALVRVARPDADASPAAMLERIERLERGLGTQVAGPGRDRGPTGPGRRSKKSPLGCRARRPRRPQSPSEPPAPKAKRRRPRSVAGRPDDGLGRRGPAQADAAGPRPVPGRSVVGRRRRRGHLRPAELVPPRQGRRRAPRGGADPGASTSAPGCRSVWWSTTGRPARHRPPRHPTTTSSIPTSCTTRRRG